MRICRVKLPSKMYWDFSKYFFLVHSVLNVLKSIYEGHIFFNVYAYLRCLIRQQLSNLTSAATNVFAWVKTVETPLKYLILLNSHAQVSHWFVFSVNIMKITQAHVYAIIQCPSDRYFYTLDFLCKHLP